MHGKIFNTSWHPGGEQNVVATGPSEPSASDQSQALTLSSSAAPKAPSTHPQYGPRWLRQRWPEDLKPWQVANLHLADEEARRIGLPQNAFITITWHLTHPGFGAMPQTFSAGMNRLGMWLRRRGVPRFAWIFVHENPPVPNTEDSRPNTHLLVHVPRKLRREFDAKLQDCFDHRITASIFGREVAQAKTSSLHLEGSAVPDLQEFGGYRARGGQGRIEVKRSGVAQCLRHKGRLTAVRMGKLYGFRGAG